MTQPDLLSAAVRAAEREIDTEHQRNPITARRFGPAAWLFLAGCEEYIVREIVKQRLPAAQSGALFDLVVVNTRVPMQWLRASCRTGGEIPRTVNGDGYDEAIRLFGLGQQYSYFESAFTYASRGVMRLEIDGNQLIPSDEFRRDTRIDAYDRLRQEKADLEDFTGVDRLLDTLASSVRVDGEWFYYDLSPRIIDQALGTISTLIDSRFGLPAHWDFPLFSMSHFHDIARLIWVLAYLHFNARLLAAARGCEGLGYSRALFTTTRNDLLGLVLCY